MSIEIGLLVAISGLVISYLAYQFNRTKSIKTDSSQSASQNAQIKAQLDYIGKGVDEIRIDQKATEKHMVLLNERVTRVEESAKQAHKRLDKYEKRELV
ncbi:hypothetical protein E2L07_05815 [Halalkalibacterium halodurans]|uniref:hypothetical protein n=1 Tax=Halalkalibacterium halodurans TaxID=86665 RepID=UPI0010676B16|nr:hypothetical protein [Halalkalibacterium halodurans]TES56200.1 hypothetical protein E2L07_05815 [Halalkalibacterium halodurans]